MPKDWLKVSLVESSEPWYHRLKVKGFQYDIGRDSTVGDRVGRRTLLWQERLYSGPRWAGMWWE